METIHQKFYNLSLIWLNIPARMHQRDIAIILRDLFGIEEYLPPLKVAEYIATHFNTLEVTILRVGNDQPYMIKALKPIPCVRNKTPQQLVQDNELLVWSICQFVTAIAPLPAVIDGEVNVDVQLNLKGWFIRDMVNAVKSTK